MAENVTRGDGFLENFLSKERIKKANKLIPDNKRSGVILDYGCGSHPRFLLQTEFKTKYGFDPYLVKEIRTDGIIIKKESLKKKFPFRKNRFDIVTMLAVFEHIEPKELNLILSEIYRILKPGGYFILTTPCKWTDRLLRTMAKYNLVSKEEIEEHKGAYNHREIIQYLTDSGFKRNKIEAGYFEMYMNNWVKARK